MNSELKTMLEAVMKEALQPIHEELQNLTNRLDTFEQKTESNFNEVKGQIAKLSEKVSVQHTENINSDNLLLNEIRSIRGDVVFVNRKVADTELELNFIRQNIKQ